MPSRGGLVARTEDLPSLVADALASPQPGEPGAVEVDGRRWPFLAWGSSSDPPLLLAHGVNSNARVWWRVGPALAAARHRVVAIDMPGHGQTAAWAGHHRFIETATCVADFIRSAELALSGLHVLGHSWGGVVAAHLPQVGVRPATLILLDPPWLTLEQLEALTRDPTERRYDSLDEARLVVRAGNPEWSEGDVIAKARALTEVDAAHVRAVLLRNGDWDAGMSALQHHATSGVRLWLIRGEPSAGGLIPEEALPTVDAVIDPEQVITITRGGHSPQRTHPEATVLAVLRALA